MTIKQITLEVEAEFDMETRRFRLGNEENFHPVLDCPNGQLRKAMIKFLDSLPEPEPTDTTLAHLQSKDGSHVAFLEKNGAYWTDPEEGDSRTWNEWADGPYVPVPLYPKEMK